MVVGLSPTVVKNHVDVTDGDLEGVFVGLVRFDEPAGEMGGGRVGILGAGACQASPPELPRVDPPVVALGQPVTGEPFGHRLVGDDVRGGVTVAFRLGDDRRRPTNMVDVTVGVHDGVYRIGAPCAQRPQDLIGEGGQ